MEGVSVRHTSRSSDLLHVEASRTRVFQSGLKTGGGVTTGGGQIDVMDCIRPFYPKVVIFIELGPKGIVFFSLLLMPINRT
jgi:hypothetical protein